MTYTFKIPALPKSVNSIYKINYRTRHVYLSEEGRKFKTLTKMYMPPMGFKSEDRLMAFFTYYSNWYFKNGKIRKVDAQNLNKLLIDAIFERLGINDCHLWLSHWEKRQSPTDYTMVNISKY